MHSHYHPPHGDNDDDNQPGPALAVVKLPKIVQYIIIEYDIHSHDDPPHDDDGNDPHHDEDGDDPHHDEDKPGPSIASGQAVRGSSLTKVVNSSMDNNCSENRHHHHHQDQDTDDNDCNGGFDEDVLFG